MALNVLTDRIFIKKDANHCISENSNQFDLLLKEYLNYHLDLKEICRSNLKHKKNSKLITELVFFEQSFPKLILFTRLLKLSINDKKALPILYEISFSSHLDNPKIKLFRVNENRMSGFYFADLELIFKSRNCLVFEALTNSPAAFTLKIFKGHSHLSIELHLGGNHDQKLRLAISSIDSDEDPLARLKAYLELLGIPQVAQIYKHELLKKVHALFRRVRISPQLAEKALSRFSADPIILHALNNYRIKRKVLKAERRLIEEIFRGDPCEKFFCVDEKTFGILHKVGDHLDFIFSKIVSSGVDFLDLYPQINDLLEKCPEVDSMTLELIISKPMEYDSFILALRKSCKPYIFKKFQLIYLDKNRFHFRHYSFTEANHLIEDMGLKGLFRPFVDLLEISRLNNFDLIRDCSVPDLSNHLFYAKGKDKQFSLLDRRLVGIALVSNQKKTEIAAGKTLQSLDIADRLEKLIAAMQHSLKSHGPTVWNRMFFKVLPCISDTMENVQIAVLEMIENHFTKLHQLHIEKVIFKFRLVDKPLILEVKGFKRKPSNLRLKWIDEVFDQLISPASKVELREQMMKIKGKIWAPHIPELINEIAEKFVNDQFHMHPNQDWCSFIEMDLDPDLIVKHPKAGIIDYNYGVLIPAVNEEGFPRALGNHKASVVVGIISSDLNLGLPVRRMLIMGDITGASRGAITGHECTLINAAIKYASTEKIPIDWFTCSYGVEIRKDKGVENLDASSATTREIIHHCHHHGLMINLIIDETNIGAQSYWDALSAILPCTTGILIMTKNGSMALTGHNALISALHHNIHSEDIEGVSKLIYPEGLQNLSGYKSIHGPNGEATAFAEDLSEALQILVHHHYYTYRKLKINLEEGKTPYPDSEMEKEVKKITRGFKADRDLILEKLRDKHSPPALPLWKDAKGFQGQPLKKGDLNQQSFTIVREMMIGGMPLMVIFPPIGPLTPSDSSLIAKAIFKADRILPVLILGTFSGFNCDPLSMENRQLELGSLIAKAVVEHHGPILIVNMGNLVGGTFVVFSKQLNPEVSILALEGSKVQVIGGQSAAKIVFHTRIKKMAETDDRVVAISNEIKMLKSNEHLTKTDKNHLKSIEEQYHILRRSLIEELENKEGLSFDQTHTAERALKVGAIDEIIAVSDLRATIIRYLRSKLELYL